jgi:hypothetical protein
VDTQNHTFGPSFVNSTNHLHLYQTSNWPSMAAKLTYIKVHCLYRWQIIRSTSNVILGLVLTSCQICFWSLSRGYHSSDTSSLALVLAISITILAIQWLCWAKDVFKVCTLVPSSKLITHPWLSSLVQHSSASLSLVPLMGTYFNMMNASNIWRSLCNLR